MSNRRQSCAPCDEGAREGFYPVCKVGQMLMFIGLGMAFLSFVLGFWLAFVGAILVLIGYLVIQCC
jgi:hypothetical protein